MSIPINVQSEELSDYTVLREEQCCKVPKIFYIFIYRDSKSPLEEVCDFQIREGVDSFSITIPALDIDEFSIVLFKLDEKIGEIYRTYGKEVAERFFSEFIERFFPDKKNDYRLIFGEFEGTLDAKIDINVKSEKYNQFYTDDDIPRLYELDSFQKRVKQLEEKAIRRIRHSKRAQHLRDYIELDDSSDNDV